MRSQFKYDNRQRREITGCYSALRSNRGCTPAGVDHAFLAGGTGRAIERKIQKKKYSDYNFE